VVTGCRLNNEANRASLLSVYPNPASGSFNIELHLDEGFNGIARIELINMMGDVMIAEDADVFEGTLFHAFTMQDRMPDAIYIVKIIVADRVFYRRIICQH
jgi:hypothetical protein